MNAHIPSDILDSLERGGLSRYQARVYSELLSLGPTTAGPLVRRTGLHRQFVYASLDALEEQGLVSHVTRNNRKLFSAARPEVLLDKQNDKLREMQLTVPKLKALATSGIKALHVEVLTGTDEFLRRLLAAVDSAARCDKVISIIGAVRDEDVYAAMGPHYHEYASYVKKKRVKRRLLASRDSAARLYRERFLNEPRTELRVAERSLSTPTATIITRELVALDIFSAEVVSLMIWSPTVAKGYLDHFAVLWESASVWTGESNRATRKQR